MPLLQLHTQHGRKQRRAPAVADNPLGADDVDVVDSDDEIVVEDDAADDAEGSDADEQRKAVPSDAE